jgi:hypothetical protein
MALQSLPSHCGRCSRSPVNCLKECQSWGELVTSTFANRRRREETLYQWNGARSLFLDDDEQRVNEALWSPCTGKSVIYCPLPEDPP